MHCDTARMDYVRISSTRSTSHKTRDSIFSVIVGGQSTQIIEWMDTKSMYTTRSADAVRLCRDMMS